jgi:hypothetical protein
MNVKLNSHLAPHVNQPATVPPHVVPSVEQVRIAVDAANTPENDTGDCGDDGGDPGDCEIQIS